MPQPTECRLWDTTTGRALNLTFRPHKAKQRTSSEDLGGPLNPTSSTDSIGPRLKSTIVRMVLQI